MEKIIEYLKATYHPVGLVVYGSFVNGTNNLNSDFDALLITAHGEEQHDHSQISGVELDVFIYPKSKFTQGYSIEEFIQIWDGSIIIDEEGILEVLKEKANEYIRQYQAKSRSENEHNLAWCEKMLQRSKRNDMEGLYRLYWLLKDSLEIYFDLRGLYYFGPKKALKQLEEIDHTAARVYFEALKDPSYDNICKWLGCLKGQLKKYSM